MSVCMTRAVERITSDWMRANMKEVLDRCSWRGERFLVMRRGKIVGGLVPPSEAKALYELVTRPHGLREAMPIVDLAEMRVLDAKIRQVAHAQQERELARRERETAWLETQIETFG